jgi:glycosyltransferase involved in cell wall biosynthesis
MQAHNKQITWFFRRKRSLGNFSIENSFSEMHAVWPQDAPKPKWLEANHFSEGLINRLRIIWEIRHVKADIIHIAGDIHFAAIGLRQPKVILTIHDLGFLNAHRGWKRALLKFFWVTWPLRFVNRLVTVSEATKRSVLKEAPWYPEANITVIHTVVHQHYKPRVQLPENPKPIALHIGLAENKNLRRHAEALSGLDVQLLIIGEPAPEDEMMLQSNEIEYTWRSKLSNEEMQQAYAESDFLLFASTLEGFGMPIIEAQMVGLPVITSDIDPMREVAEDGGLLCDPLDSNSIRAAVTKLLADPSLQKQIMVAGFENHPRFAPASAAKQLNNLYQNLK